MGDDELRRSGRGERLTEAGVADFDAIDNRFLVLFTKDSLLFWDSPGLDGDGVREEEVVEVELELW
jgi:hypothetical protein